mgnify:CR=1 FL=1
MSIIKILMGILLISTGLFIMLLYLNLLIVNFNIIDYLIFVLRRKIYIFFLLGIYLIYKGMMRLWIIIMM